MAAFFYVQVLWILPLTFTNPVFQFFQPDAIRDEYARIVQCSANQKVKVNDYAKTVVMNCKGNEASTSNLLNCTGLPRISIITFVECKLPTANINSLVKDFNLQALLYIIVYISPTPQEIIVKDLPTIELLGLTVRNNAKYTLQNLPSLQEVNMMICDVDVFPETLFSNLPLLKHVVIQHGRIGSFPASTFRRLKRLEIMRLGNNSLTTLPSSLFKGMQLLKRLELQYNKLKSLPSNIFQDLVGLEKLPLLKNLFVQLPSTLFINQRNLKLLVLSNNRNLVHIPEDLLANTRSLMTFSADNCNLTVISEKLFSSANNLQLLRLENNKLSSLPTKVFENNTHLTELHLSRNQLRILPETIFRRNYELKYLWLDGNLFKSIPIEALVNTKSIMQIFLSNNYIANADEQRLGLLKNLRLITLARNNISSFSSSTPFGSLQNLAYLDLSFNNFETFPTIDWNAYNIYTLKMSNNRISHLEISTLPPQNSLIDLRFNNIQSISLPINESAFNQEILKIYLSANPFMCDCKLREFLQSLHDYDLASRPTIFISDAEELTCSSPSSWESQNLMQISPLYLLCPVRNLCPQECRCYRLKNLMVLVNCSSRGLAEFPYILPVNTTIVHLENNSISEFTTVSMNHWDKVTHLYLDSNRFVAPTFWPMLNVKYLSLRNNRLIQLPEVLMEHIGNTSQFLLDIRDNSWICNCTYLSFKLWLAKHKEKIVNPEEILCNRTSLENGTSLFSPILKVPNDAFCFDTYSVAVRISVAVFASCSVFVAAVIFITLHFGNKQAFMAYLYSHFPFMFSDNISETEKNKPYDAFISYTSSDREAVLAVLKELETKPPNFKFCVHERDWLPGYPVISQIESAVQNSKKTIIFLSQEFLDSFWCETELQAAYMQSLEDKVERLIIIIKGELPERDSMPLDIQNLLATKTYLVWGERWFWEKLKYALPHYIRTGRKMEQEVTVEGLIQDLREAKLI